MVNRNGIPILSDEEIEKAFRDREGMMKHTELPWGYARTHRMSDNTWYVLVDSDGRGPIMEVGGKDLVGQIAEAKYLITDPEKIKANAAFIVRACNNHYKLLEALKRLINSYVNLIESGHDRIKDLGGACDSVEIMENGNPYLAEAREAIKEAGV